MELIVIPLARRKLEQRHIPIAWIEETIANPGQCVAGYGGRVVYQRLYQLAGGEKEQLLRVVCEETPARRVVVTAYLTSEIKRYWKE